MKIFNLFKDLAADDIVLQYLAFRNCEFKLIPTLRNIIENKYGMAFGSTLNLDEKNLINKALTDVINEKNYDIRAIEFFQAENVRSCTKNPENYSIR